MTGLGYPTTRFLSPRRSTGPIVPTVVPLFFSRELPATTAVTVAASDQLEYEAYEAQVEPRLAELAAEARTRWPAVGRLVMMHRVGELVIGDSAVVVVASSPHRPEAFAAARFCIDALKATIPIWKRERWDEGESWGLEAQHIIEVDDLDNATVAADGSVTLSVAPLNRQLSKPSCHHSSFSPSHSLSSPSAQACCISRVDSAAVGSVNARRPQTCARSLRC